MNKFYLTKQGKIAQLTIPNSTSNFIYINLFNSLQDYDKLFDTKEEIQDYLNTLKEVNKKLLAPKKIIKTAKKQRKFFGL